MFIRTSLPCRIGPRKVALQTELCRDLLVLSILGAVVQGQRSSALGWELSETPDDRLGRRRGAFTIELGDQQKPTLSFDHGMERGLTLPRDEGIALPVAVLLSLIHGPWTDVDRNSIGNLGLFLFSTDALGFAFFMSSS